VDVRVHHLVGRRRGRRWRLGDHPRPAGREHAGPVVASHGCLGWCSSWCSGC